ncbi:MAG: amidohydrolase [Thermoflexales bacterium]
MTDVEYAALECEILEAIDADHAGMVALSRDIHAHPEIMFEERYAAAALTTALAERGFEVQRGAGGLETAFVAMSGGIAGPTIAFIAEYDALPGIGHACGHNLIATSALAAGFALNRVIDRLPGQIAVIGTPAEEGGGGKVTMRDAGVFAHIDAVLMTHMAMETVTRPVFLAVASIEIAYHGRASHAAAAPEAGINALDALIQFFNGINALRQHVRADARMHGIILNGGQAANIVPEFASAKYVVRARDMVYVRELVLKARACAEAAALATGARLEFTAMKPLEHVASNGVMADLYGEKLRGLGWASTEIQKDGPASTDMGPLSHAVPAIHPLVQIADFPVAWHTPEFREAAWSDRGQEGMRVAAKAMALTALDLLVKPGLLDAVKADFAQLPR